jgi:hypothetical protein
MKTTWEQLFKDVDEFEQKLAKPTEFRDMQFVTYYTAAVKIAEQVLINSRPPNHQDRAGWDRKARTTASRVAGQFTLGGGIMLSLSPQENISGELKDKDSRPFEQKMAHSDMVQWIEAGMAGLPGGKRITAEDEAFIRKYGIKAKATVLMRAYYSREPVAAYARLRRAVQRYFHGTEETDNSPLLDAVLAAWEAHFSVIYPKDMELWVASKTIRF